VNEARPAQLTWLRVQDYLRDHYAQRLTRDSVAARLNLHPNYLSGLCRRQGGISFQGELQRIRIERAKYLLSQTKFSLEAVATACGFSDSKHLTRAFNRDSGTTPAAYRRQHLS
jgi:two-component system response regulator YesN